MKSLIMKEAWEIAGRASRLKGGTKKEWFAYSLVRAWKKFKEGKLTATPVEVKPTYFGRMTEKQENFISSLLWKKDGKYEECGLVKAFKADIRSNISKQQASDLISRLLAC